VGDWYTRESFHDNREGASLKMTYQHDLYRQQPPPTTYPLCSMRVSRTTQRHGEVCCIALCLPWSRRLAAPALPASVAARLEARVSGSLYTRDLVARILVSQSFQISRMQLACKTVAIYHGGCCDASSLVTEPSPVVLARWPPDRCGFVPLKRPPCADRCPYPNHTPFEQLRCLRRVHNAPGSHM
jgi:hypothetical protein